MMRILVLGAGATGGYFGGRLIEAGCDVTFLVRPARAERLSETGLIVESPLGNIREPVRAVTTDAVAPNYDVILLSCKAFDLDDAITAIAPAVAAEAKGLPILNGISHLDRLDKAFGASHVLGGLCQIAATLAPDGTVRHLNQTHSLVFGHRDQTQRPFCEQLQASMAAAKMDVRRSNAILHEMWEKWVMLATLAACTCLMRAPVGDIVAAPGGQQFILGTLDEVQAIATANGNAAAPKLMEQLRTMLTQRGSSFAASMLRDLEGAGRIEADHIIGDLLRRGDQQGIEMPMLRVAYTHLKAYEARRDRLAQEAHVKNAN